jgi:hypothetical protein
MRNFDMLSAHKISRLGTPRYTIIKMSWHKYKINIVEIIDWLESPTRKGLYRTFHDMYKHEDQSVPHIGVGIQRATIALEFKMRWG